MERKVWYDVGNQTFRRTNHTAKWIEAEVRIEDTQRQSMVSTKIEEEWGQFVKIIYVLIFFNIEFYRRAHGHTAEEQTQFIRNRQMTTYINYMQEILGNQSKELQVNIFRQIWIFECGNYYSKPIRIVLFLSEIFGVFIFFTFRFICFMRSGVDFWSRNTT